MIRISDKGRWITQITVEVDKAFPTEEAARAFAEEMAIEIRQKAPRKTTVRTDVWKAG